MLASQKPMHTLLTDVLGNSVRAIKLMILDIVSLFLEARDQSPAAVINAQDSIICAMGDVDIWLALLMSSTHMHSQITACVSFVLLCSAELHVGSIA